MCEVGSVVSRDGARIAYRRVGEGPAVVLLHGGAQAAQNLMRLAQALADEFAVYVPDRRGRGRSGPPSDGYGLRVECEDVEALLTETGARFVFGLSSGALIALQAALTLPTIERVALYEPPLSIDHSTPIGWVARYDREVAEGKLGSAMLTVVRGTETAPRVLRVVPRAVLAPLLNAAARRGSKTVQLTTPTRSVRRAALRFLLRPLRKLASKDSSGNPTGGGKADVPLGELVPTMHYDAQLVIESEGSLANFRDVQIDVLLLGGSKSPRYLKQSLDGLERTLPQVTRVELAGADHLAPDNSGKPTVVAEQLKRFFGAAPQG